MEQTLFYTFIRGFASGIGFMLIGCLVFHLGIEAENRKERKNRNENNNK